MGTNQKRAWREICRKRSDFWWRAVVTGNARCRTPGPWNGRRKDNIGNIFKIGLSISESVPSESLAATIAVAVIGGNSPSPTFFPMSRALSYVKGG